jgi:ABC-type glycerol-3-phosphate transport system substrate-binding protein
MLINASSQMKDEAWEFVQFMTSEERQKAYTLSASTLPTLNALYGDREILEEVPVVDLSKEALQKWPSRRSRANYSGSSSRGNKSANQSPQPTPLPFPLSRAKHRLHFRPRLWRIPYS